MKVLIINPGATSTKIAVYEESTEEFKKSIDHDIKALEKFNHVIDQADFRYKCISDALSEAGYKMSDFSAVCGRGGLLKHIKSGTYRINDRVIEDVENPPYGEHASNLGVVLSKKMADSANIPSFFVDPVSVDELIDIARISGFKGMERQSFFHALNQKSTARKASVILGKPYQDLNLIVVHLGGGVSVAAHRKGEVIDVFNVKDEGAMGLDRGGSLPTNAIINLCFSGKSKAEIKKLLGSEAGVVSYLGTKDFREVVKRAFSGTDSEANLIFRALAFQLAKDIGAEAAVLCFDVDAVVYTGGMAYSEEFIKEIDQYVSHIAKKIVLPGENEMASLAEGAFRVLHGEKPLEYL